MNQTLILKKKVHAESVGEQMLPKRVSHKKKLPAVVAEAELSSPFFSPRASDPASTASAADQIARQKKLSLSKKKW